MKLGKANFKVGCVFYSLSRFFFPQLSLDFFTYIYAWQTAWIKKLGGSVVDVHINTPWFAIFTPVYSLEWHFLVLFPRLLWTGNLGILRHWEKLIKRLQQFPPTQTFSEMEGWKEMSAVIPFKSLRNQWCGISWCCYFLYIWSRSSTHHHWQFFGRACLVLEASELLPFLNKTVSLETKTGAHFSAMYLGFLNTKHHIQPHERWGRWWRMRGTGCVKERNEAN